MLAKETFLNPPAKYRPIPFWFWNSKMRKPEIERQIRDFHDKGLGGFFIHARFGLETPYMSDEWLEAIQHAVDTASELDMEVWLYDENAFPSGVGDLKVSSILEYRPKHIDLEETEGCVPDGDVILSLPVNGKTAHFVRRVIDDPNDVVFGVDYLSADAMQAFFDMTLEPYERALGKHFGNTIKGIFTDEPVLLPWHHDINWYGQLRDTKVVVWDDEISVQMKSRFGLELQDFLPHLFYDIDETTPDRRRQYWRVVSDLFVKAFFGPYSKWCEDHNLKLTGHVLFEEGLFLNTDFQSDIVENLQRMHIPGTDHLGACTEVAYGGFSNTPKMLTNIQGEKLVTSISHVYEKEACISETFGCADWGLTPEQMKWMVDWQYSIGVNMFCPHAVFYSIEGYRKSDAPPSQNHMTFWKDHRIFSDYVGRLSYVLRQGKHVAKVAVEYPLEKFWEVHRVGDPTEEERILSDQYDLVCSTLVSKQIDYDIIPAGEIRQDRIRNGRLNIGKEEYEHLIAFRESPVSDMPVTVIGPKAGIEDVDMDSLPSSVKVTAAGGKIQYIERQMDDQRVFFFINSSDTPVTADISLDASGQIELWNPETGSVEEVANVELINDRIVVHTGFAPYGSTIYVVDTSKNFKAPVAAIEVSRRTIAVIDRWRFKTLTPNALPLDHLEMSMRTHGGGTDYAYSTQVDFKEAPGELKLLLDDIEYRSSLMGGMDILVEVNGQEFRELIPWEVDPHMKTVDILPAITQGTNSIVIRIRHSAWSGQPLVLNSIPIMLGDFAVDYPDWPYAVKTPPDIVNTEPWTLYGYPFFSGTVSYTSEFNATGVQDSEKVWVEVDDVSDAITVLVNGQKAGTRLWRPWRVDITPYVKQGRNEIELQVTNTMQNMLERNPKTSGLLGPVNIIQES